MLVDVRESFRAALARAVQHAVVAATGLRDDGPLVDADVIRTFKRAAGFNNDWDLAHTLALWYIESAAGARSTSEIRARAGDPMAAARVSPRARASRLPRPTFDEVKGLMLELYWGSAEAARRFGVRPRLDNGDPLLSRERVLLRAETVPALRRLGVARFGVLTGRVRTEWEAVRERLPLPPDVAVATDEDGRKPDPLVLRRLVDLLGARRPCYLGDVIDDWRLVEAYGARFTEAPALGVFVVTDAADERALREAGARHFLRDVNAVPGLLATL